MIAGTAFPDFFWLRPEKGIPKNQYTLKNTPHHSQGGIRTRPGMRKFPGAAGCLVWTVYFMGHLTPVRGEYFHL
ncbi:MAG: hypothetical protein B6245_00645 [Desulfobacteraceae bacterium 4572_88]|nr:MAG: hypothetical protein B6245_00645 [Desulfobacteraceae bacterium 4572_88]